MAANAPQIVHEAEIHRQHVRLRIPITVEIDGTRFVTDDWSIGGFGVLGQISSREPGERFPVRLVFPFEDFEISLRADCQLVYVTEDRTRFGCRFLALTRSQIDLFRYIVDSYLAGEIVTAGDVLAFMQSEKGPESQVRALARQLEAEERSFGRRIRRWLGYTAMTASALALVAVVALGIWERYVVVRSDDAVIWTPILALQSPLSGRIEAMPRKVIYEPGDPLARVVGLEGGEAVLQSPCECVILEWPALPGEYVQAGDPVLVLAAADQPLQVRAQIPIEQAARLQVGQRAQVWLPGEREPRLAQIERIDFKPRLSLLADPGAGGVRPNRAQVYLRPDRPFDFDTLGTLVSVRFL